MNGNMPKKPVDQNLNRRLNKRQLWTVRLGLAGVASLLILALASTVVNFPRPNVPGRTRRVASRVNWYLYHDQLQAEARTFVAALQYIMQTDGETPVVTNFSNLPVAGTGSLESPKS